MSVKSTIDEIRRITDKIWRVEPEEIRKCLDVDATYYQHLMTGDFVECETRQMVDELYIIRISANRNDVNLGSLKAIMSVLLSFYETKWDKGEDWFKKGSLTNKVLHESKAIVDKVESKDEFKDLVEAILLFIGKVNFWIDARIPWAELTGTYEPLWYKNRTSNI